MYVYNESKNFVQLFEIFGRFCILIATTKFQKYLNWKKIFQRCCFFFVAFSIFIFNYLQSQSLCHFSVEFYSVVSIRLCYIFCFCFLIIISWSGLCLFSSLSLYWFFSCKLLVVVVVVKTIVWCCFLFCIHSMNNSQSDKR